MVFITINNFNNYMIIIKIKHYILFKINYINFINNPINKYTLLLLIILNNDFNKYYIQ